jgi:hypothetical protein
MDIPNYELFLKRFIEVNVEVYKDDPAFVAQLNALTLDTLVITNLRKADLEGKVYHTVDVEKVGLLKGFDQHYYPADYVEHHAAKLEDPEPKTVEVLQTRTLPGVYLVLVNETDHKSALLVNHGEKTIEALTALVKAKSKVVLTDEQITVSEDLSTVTIDSPTVIGLLQVYESIYDELPRWNGEYVYDGTLTY